MSSRVGVILTVIKRTPKANFWLRIVTYIDTIFDERPEEINHTGISMVKIYG
jgi:hypothetical protein